MWKWFLELTKGDVKCVLGFESFVEPKQKVKEGPKPVPRFECELCHKQFESHKAVVNHKRIHHKQVTLTRQLVNKDVCLVCKRKFASPESAKNHVQRSCFPKLPPHLQQEWLNRVENGQLGSYLL